MRPSDRDRLIAERDRLVGWATTDAGERVTLRPGDRVTFLYKDSRRVGTVLSLHRIGFRMREDEDPRPKVFDRGRVTEFSFVSEQA